MTYNRSKRTIKLLEKNNQIKNNVNVKTMYAYRQEQMLGM